MKGRKLLCLLAIAGLWPSGALAATAACAVEASESTRTPLVRTTTDQATGAKIVSRRDPSGALIVELAGKDVTVRRAFDGLASTTTFAAGDERVTIKVSGADVVVVGSGKVFRANAESAASVDQAAMYLRHSQVASRGKDLLDRVDLHPETFAEHALLLTRGLMGAIWGEKASTLEYQRWIKSKLTPVRIIRAAISDGPGDCWDRYTAEANRISSDLESCVTSCSSFFCFQSCGFIYEVRAEAAFMWYVSCNGKFFVG